MYLVLRRYGSPWVVVFGQCLLGSGTSDACFRRIESRGERKEKRKKAQDSK